ncbi:MAG TPA: hypothetical protein DD727_03665, partial [Clostridiales bacterium]|nr:hypothetical protein [Clostridiales bacterium]
MKKPAPMSFKPDLAEAAKRWEAYWQGEMIDRPVVWVTAPRKGHIPVHRYGYREKVFGNLDEIIDNAIYNAGGTFYGGEAVPAYFPSFGPDEVAVFCGAELCWNDHSSNTNWSKPYVDNWEDVLPLKLQQDHPLWQRMLEFYRKAAEKMSGKMLVMPLDLHTNMDLLAAIRSPEKLCMDLLDVPELIDRAMADARSVFPQLWNAIVKAGRMEENGYANNTYSPEGAAVLQCDFSCMMSPDDFRRWVLPALEEEAEYVKHVVYHWDGLKALLHKDAVIESKGLHTMAFVPGTGHGAHI